MEVQGILADVGHLVRHRCVKVFLDMIILSSLKERELSGYDVIKIVYDRFGVLLGPGSIYPVLNYLKGKNIVYEKDAERKKLYSLTEEGSLYTSLLFEEYEKFYSQIKF